MSYTIGMTSKPHPTDEEILKRVEKEKLEGGKLESKEAFEGMVKKVGKTKK